MIKRKTRFKKPFYEKLSDFESRYKVVTELKAKSPKQALTTSEPGYKMHFRALIGTFTEIPLLIFISLVGG